MRLDRHYPAESPCPGCVGFDGHGCCGAFCSDIESEDAQIVQFNTVTVTLYWRSGAVQSFKMDADDAGRMFAVMARAGFARTFLLGQKVGPR